MQVHNVSGVELYQHWKLNNQSIYVFGEDHRNGPKQGCKTCTSEQSCYTFMSFLERLQQDKPLNLYVELSYVNSLVYTKDIPSLAVIPKVLENSNLSELRQKHLRCIWKFAEPPLDYAETCSLHNVETYASDLRLEKVFDETRSTLEYTKFTQALKSLFEYVDKACENSKTVLRFEQLRPYLSKSDFRSMFNNPGLALYDLIVNEINNHSSVLARTYKRLLAANLMTEVELKRIIFTMVKYYDEADGYQGNKGVDVRRWLMKNLIDTPRETFDCDELTEYIFLFLSSYGTMITDIFIMMQCILHHKDTNVILTGTFHSHVYALILESMGAKLAASGTATSSSSFCLEVTPRTTEV